MPVGASTTGLRSWDGVHGYRLLFAYVRIEVSIALPAQVKSRFLPDSDYARAKSVDWAEMELAQKTFTDRYLAEVR